MIRLDLALFAHAANTTASNELNVLGELNLVLAPSFPCRHHLITAVLRFVADPVDIGPHSFGVRFVDGNGNLLWSSPDLPLEIQASKFQGIPARALVILPLSGLEFPEEGPYTLEPFVDGRRITDGPELHAVKVDSAGG